MLLTKTDEPVRHKLHANEGAQAAFLSAPEQFPALIMGFRGGKTWGGAGRLLVWASAYRGVNGLCVAPTFGLVRRIMLPAVQEQFQNAGIPTTWRTADYELVIPSFGSSIYFHSGLHADRITGFEIGFGWVDEPGRTPDFPDPRRNVWKNCIARLRDTRVPPEFRSMWVTGTHEGPATWLYDRWEKNPEPGHVVYRGHTSENPKSEEFVKLILREYGEDLAVQYLAGGVVDDMLAVIDFRLLEACTSETAHVDFTMEELARASGPVFGGMDIGRSASLTAFWLWCREPDGTFRTLGVKVLRTTRFSEQFEELGRIMACSSVQALAIDGTYNPETAEKATERWGERRIKTVVFNQRNKVEMADTLRRYVDEGRVLIPNDDDIAHDFFAVKRQVGPLGNVRITAPYTSDGHSDRFWAACLGLHAAADRVVFSTSGGVLTSTTRWAERRGGLL